MISSFSKRAAIPLCCVRLEVRGRLFLVFPGEEVFSVVCCAELCLDSTASPAEGSAVVAERLSECGCGIAGNTLICLGVGMIKKVKKSVVFYHQHGFSVKENVKNEGVI